MKYTTESVTVQERKDCLDNVEWSTQSNQLQYTKCKDCLCNVEWSTQPNQLQYKKARIASV